MFKFFNDIIMNNEWVYNSKSKFDVPLILKSMLYGCIDINSFLKYSKDTFFSIQKSVLDIIKRNIKNISVEFKVQILKNLIRGGYSFAIRWFNDSRYMYLRVQVLDIVIDNIRDLPYESIFDVLVCVSENFLKFMLLKLSSGLFDY